MHAFVQCLGLYAIVKSPKHGQCHRGWQGPRGFRLKPGDPHYFRMGLVPLGAVPGAKVWQVQGSYDYYHYMQDRIDDSVRLPPTLSPIPETLSPNLHLGEQKRGRSFVPAQVPRCLPASVLRAAPCSVGCIPQARSGSTILLPSCGAAAGGGSTGLGLRLPLPTDNCVLVQEPAVHASGSPKPQVNPKPSTPMELLCYAVAAS